MVIRLGSRGSRLALTQGALAADALRDARPGVEIALVPITTAGDRDRSRPFGEIGARGVFVKELEEALLARSVDVAVHSAKDMTSTDAAGLSFGAYLEREDPRDALCGAGDLRAGMRIGTASTRRRAQLLALDGAQILINVSASPGRDVAAVHADGLGTAESWSTIMRAYAQLTTSLVVFVNRVGVDESISFWGGSQVIGPAGDVRFQAPFYDEYLYLVEVDLADPAPEKWREVVPEGRDVIQGFVPVGGKLLVHILGIASDADGTDHLARVVADLQAATLREDLVAGRAQEIAHKDRPLFCSDVYEL